LGLAGGAPGAAAARGSGAVAYSDSGKGLQWRDISGTRFSRGAPEEAPWEHLEATRPTRQERKCSREASGEVQSASMVDARGDAND